MRTRVGEEIEQQECCRSKIVSVAHLCLLRNRSFCTNYVYPFVLIILLRKALVLFLAVLQNPE